MTLTLYPVVGLDRLVDGATGSIANVVTLLPFQRVPKYTLVIYPLESDQETAATFTGKTLRVSIGDSTTVAATADCTYDPVSGSHTCILPLNTAEMVSFLEDETYAKLRFEIQAVSLTDDTDREPVLLCDCYVYPNVIRPDAVIPSALVLTGTPILNEDTGTFYKMRLRGTGDNVSIEFVAP